MEPQLARLVDLVLKAADAIGRIFPAAVSIGLAVASFSFIHYVFYVLYFDASLIPLIALDGFARMMLVVSLFFTAVFGLVRITQVMIFGAESPNLLKLIPPLSELKIGPLDISNNEYRIYTYIFTFILFQYFYIGWSRMVQLSIIVSFAFVVVLLGWVVLRAIGNALWGSSSTSLSSVSVPFFVLIVGLTGNYRADYISQVDSHAVVVDQTGVEYKGTIYLSGAEGLFIYSTKDKETTFISWEMGVRVKSLTPNSNHVRVQNYLGEF